MKIRVLDTETTGFPPEAGVVEFGWCDIIGGIDDMGMLRDDVKILDWKSELCKPNYKIEIAAKAVHHITEEEIKDARPPEDVLRDILTDDVDYFCAHNSKFEREFIKTQQPWICTFKAALRLCPKSPNHQNQTIRYFLNTPVDPTLCIPAHRAGPDAYVTAHTLVKFLSAIPPNVLSKWEGEPPQFPYCPIGKEKGKPWSEVDQGFLMWICYKAPTMDEDIKWNALQELNRRKGN